MNAATPGGRTESSDPGATEIDGVLLLRLIEAWPEPALVADRHGAVAALNDAARGVLGLPPDAVPATLDELMDSATAADLASAGHKPVERFVGDDSAPGGRRVLRVRSSSLAESHVVVSLADVSAESRLRTNLGHAERLASVGEHLSSVAHELNNPLTTVLGYADLLLSENDPHLPRAEVERIRSEAQRCRRIVGNLLDLARSETVDLRPVVIREVIEKVVEIRSYACRSTGIELTVRCAEVPVVLGDFHRLVQAVLNLVTNAEDAVRGRPEPRRVEVTTSSDGRLVFIEVTDNGPGVPAEIRPFVFQPFFTTKPRGKGTGLGLSLVRETAVQHEGDVRCDDAPGGGARFVMELPV